MKCYIPVGQILSNRSHAVAVINIPASPSQRGLAMAAKAATAPPSRLKALIHRHPPLPPPSIHHQPSARDRAVRDEGWRPPRPPPAPRSRPLRGQRPPTCACRWASVLGMGGGLLTCPRSAWNRFQSSATDAGLNLTDVRRNLWGNGGRGRSRLLGLPSDHFITFMGQLGPQTQAITAFLHTNPVKSLGSKHSGCGRSLAQTTTTTSPACPGGWSRADHQQHFSGFPRFPWLAFRWKKWIESWLILDPSNL